MLVKVEEIWIKDGSSLRKHRGWNWGCFVVCNYREHRFSFFPPNDLFIRQYASGPGPRFFNEVLSNLSISTQPSWGVWYQISSSRAIRTPPKKKPKPKSKQSTTTTSYCICLVSGYFLLSQLPLSSLVACWWSSSKSGNHMTSRKTAAGSSRLRSSSAWCSWLAPVCFCLPALLLLACLSPPQILSLPLFFPSPLPPLPPPPCFSFVRSNRFHHPSYCSGPHCEHAT